MIGRKRLSRVARQSICGVTAAITVLVGFSDMNNFTAMGLYLTLVAGIAWVVALVWEATELNKARNF